MQEMQEMQVLSWDQEDPLEEGMAAYSSVLAWGIPWAEELGRLQSIGSQRVRPDWVSTCACQYLLSFLVIQVVSVISFCLFLLSSQKAQPLQDCLPCRIHLFDSASPVDHSWESSVCVISPPSLFFFVCLFVCFWVQRKSFCQSMHTPAIVINKVLLVLPLREYHLFLEDITMWPC